MNACEEINKTKLLELVERDKPKKVRKIPVSGGDTWYSCGQCGRLIAIRSEMAMDLPDKFCWNCGKRIDWGNEI